LPAALIAIGEEGEWSGSIGAFCIQPVNAMTMLPK